jgi:hypothetical protein
VTRLVEAACRKKHFARDAEFSLLDVMDDAARDFMEVCVQAAGLDVILGGEHAAGLVVQPVPELARICAADRGHVHARAAAQKVPKPGLPCAVDMDRVFNVSFNAHGVLLIFVSFENNGAGAIFLRDEAEEKSRERSRGAPSSGILSASSHPIRTVMKRAKDLNQLMDLVHEAVYEVDELRACLEHDDEEASTYTPYLDPLDTMLRDLHESMASGRYPGVGRGDDLPFMELFKKHERSIPFRELLRTINATHREGYES